jgi:hypothetical protein
MVGDGSVAIAICMLSQAQAWRLGVDIFGHLLDD